MIATEPEKFFTEPHYNGYPAVLLHLPTMRVPELRGLLRDAWRCAGGREPEPLPRAGRRATTTSNKRGASKRSDRG